MKAVITGFDSRSCRTAAGENRLSFGYLIGELLVDQGFSVHQHQCWPEDPECKEHLRTADLIFVGISSPLALTSHYAMSAMAIMSEFEGDARLRFFVDDPNIAKIRYGSASAVRRWEDEGKDPLFGNSLFYRRPHYEDAKPRKEVFYDVCRQMADWSKAAPTFAPVSQTFGDYGLSAQNLGIIPLDVTSIAHSKVDGYFDTRPRSKSLPRKLQSWYVEPWVVGGSKWAEGVQTARDKVSVQTNGWKDKIENIVAHYGVLESPKSRDIAGWWSPAPVLAAVGRQFYATSTSEARLIGSPDSAYYTLPYVYEELKVSDQQSIIEAQRDELLALSPSIEMVSKVLTERYEV